MTFGCVPLLQLTCNFPRLAHLQVPLQACKAGAEGSPLALVQGDGRGADIPHLCRSRPHFHQRRLLLHHRILERKLQGKGKESSHVKRLCMICDTRELAQARRCRNWRSQLSAVPPVRCSDDSASGELSRMLFEEVNAAAIRSNGNGSCLITAIMCGQEQLQIDSPPAGQDKSPSMGGHGSSQAGHCKPKAQ